MLVKEVWNSGRDIGANMFLLAIWIATLVVTIRSLRAHFKPAHFQWAGLQLAFGRICLFPVVYGFHAWLTFIFPGVAGLLAVIGDAYQGYTMYLFMQSMVIGLGGREAVVAKLSATAKQKNLDMNKVARCGCCPTPTLATAGAPVRCLCCRYTTAEGFVNWSVKLVYQFYVIKPLVSLLSFVFQVADVSESAETNINLILNIIGIASVLLAMQTIVGFLRFFFKPPDLLKTSVQRILLQLIVVLANIQTIIIGQLISREVIGDGLGLEADIRGIRINSSLIILEMLFLAVIFSNVFSHSVVLNALKSPVYSKLTSSDSAGQTPWKLLLTFRNSIEKTELQAVRRTSTALPQQGQGQNEA